MNIYVVLLLLIYVWLIVGLAFQINKKLYLAVPLLLLMAFTGLRFDTGRDIHNYERMFEAISCGSDYTDIGGGFSVEISYYWITKLMIKFNLRFQSLIFLYSALSYTLVFLSLQNLRINKFETFVFLSVFMDFEFLTYFTLMRQFLSAAIIFYVYSNCYETKKEFICGILFLVVAGLVHTPAFIIIPLYVIFKHNATHSLVFSHLVIFLSILFGASSIAVGFLNSHTSSLGQYARFTADSNFGERGAISIILVIFTVIYLMSFWITGERKNNWAVLNNLKLNKNIALYDVSSSILLLFVIYYSSISLSYFNRSYWYLALSLGLVPVILQRKIKTKSKDLSLYFGVAVVFFMFVHTLFIYVNLGNSDPLMLPYKFSLNF